jgi:anti-sigma factor RsiW
MNCDYELKLDRYVDSELNGAELTDLQAHLQTCPSCAATALNRLQLKRLTQITARAYRPSPEFRAKIQESISPQKRARWSMNWLPAFAAIALLLFAAVLWRRHTRGEQTMGELADLHVATLASANPVDVVSTDRHTVKPWFQGKLPFTFNLPELQSSPFKLVGGRLAYLQQTPGAQLLYQIGKHQISVFIFQDRLLTSAGSTTKLTFTSDTFDEGGLRYFLVGDCSPSDLHKLAELLKTANS